MTLKVVKNLSGDTGSGADALPTLQEDNLFDQKQQQQQHQGKSIQHHYQYQSQQSYNATNGQHPIPVVPTITTSHTTTTTGGGKPQRRRGGYHHQAPPIHKDHETSNTTNNDVNLDNEAYAQGEFIDDSGRGSIRTTSRRASLENGSDESLTKKGTSERNMTIFENARIHIHPGRTFRLVTRMYAERKLLVVALVHFVCTMVIWSK